MYIIAVASQTISMVGLNFDSAFFHFFKDTCIGKNHEYLNFGNRNLIFE
jgi:hypothetical protein